MPVCIGAEFIISSKLRISFSSLRLRDFVYVEKVKTCIKETVSEYYLSGDINDLLNVELTCNDQVFFEILKMKIRSISISHNSIFLLFKDDCINSLGVEFIMSSMEKNAYNTSVN
jgi:hypothetical protein